MRESLLVAIGTVSDISEPKLNYFKHGSFVFYGGRYYSLCVTALLKKNIAKTKHTKTVSQYFQLMQRNLFSNFAENPRKSPDHSP
jgi:hypothetical protein